MLPPQDEVLSRELSKDTHTTITLEEDHRVILEMVYILDLLYTGVIMREEAVVPIDILKQIVDFFRLFANGYHCGKEENALFTLLAQKSAPTKLCSVTVLVKEHQLGRTLVQEIAEAASQLEQGNPAAKDQLLANIKYLLDLYQNHIWKENYLLFPIIKTLSEPEKTCLFQSFKKFDQTAVEHKLIFEELYEFVRARRISQDRIRRVRCQLVCLASCKKYGTCKN